MPNWCENRMTVKHTDPAMLQRARDAWMTGYFLNEFIPVPEDLKIVSGRVGDDTNPEQMLLVAQQEKNKATHGYQDWHSFCVNEWGTKWDIGYREHECNEPYDETENSFTVRYDSAWSPPEAACFKLVAMGFDITNHYYEPGMGFCGVFEDGFDHCYNIREAPDELKEMFEITSLADIELSREELIKELLEEDNSSENPENIKKYMLYLLEMGTVGYKNMSLDELKEEYINRGLHE